MLEITESMRSINTQVKHDTLSRPGWVRSTFSITMTTTCGDNEDDAKRKLLHIINEFLFSESTKGDSVPETLERIKRRDYRLKVGKRCNEQMDEYLGKHREK